MKGSWFTTIAAAGIILVLTGFLALQYSWLRQASDAEKEKMQRRLDSDTQSFADDLNRELQLAYFNFQTDSSVWERSDWTAFNERYQVWHNGTQYPELIKQFVFFKTGSAEPLTYVSKDGVFKTLTDLSGTGDLTALRQMTETGDLTKRFYDEPMAFVVRVPKDASITGPILIRQMNSADPTSTLLSENYGTLLVLLDRKVVTDKMIPDLIAKHFPEKNYRVAVKNASEEPVFLSDGGLTASDAEAGLLSLMPSNFIVVDRLVSASGDRKPVDAVRGVGRIETRTFTRTQVHTLKKDGDKTINFQITPKSGEATATATAVASVEGKPMSTSIINGTAAKNDPWKLNIQHTSGSIAAFIQSELNRKLMIGALLYLLAAAAIVAIVLSALRSRRYAQRQIDFVSSVSHEFRTPLAVVYSAAENLADGLAKDPQQVVRYGELIKGEGKRLNGMVEQILEFAGARSGKQHYKFAKIDIVESVRNALTDCVPLLEEQGFSVETDLDKVLPDIDADSDAIGGAVKNLITNAAKYSNGTRWIKVSVVPTGDAVNIVVADQGIGIEKSDSKRIFEPFFRSKSVVDAQIRGNGLGLSMVKDVAIAHGGSVRAERNADKGSTFTITLPTGN